MPGKLQLNDLVTTIAGKVRGLFAWPTVMLGMDGDTPVPLLTDSDGKLVTTVDNASSITLGAITGEGSALAPDTGVLTVQRPAVTQVKSTALEASHVLKASAGQLVELSVFSSAAGFILLMNSATVPGDGAVVLLYPPIPIAAEQLVVLDLPAPLVASTGISACISSTGSFTKTVGGSTCVFYAQVN